VQTLKFNSGFSTITDSGLRSFAVARAELVAIHVEDHNFTEDQLQALRQRPLPANIIIERKKASESELSPFRHLR